MLSDLAGKKETFFDLKNANFWLFRFGQNIVSALFAIQVLRTSGYMTRKLYSVHHRKRPHSFSTEGSFHKKSCKMNTWLNYLSSTQLSGKSNSQ